MSTEQLSPEALTDEAQLAEQDYPQELDPALADEPQLQPEMAAPAPQPLDPIASLPLQLTLRCGQLTLSLEQLRQLGSGSVLEVQGIAPGHASLCHGEQVVAEGELVEVDGRLGLQITRMASLA